MIDLCNADVRLGVDPARGGGITCFQWRSVDLFRPALAAVSGPLGLASFVLVPFSNRIANARFGWRGETITLHANEPPHALHGTGWLAPWSVTRAAADELILHLDHSGPGWPSTWRALQHFRLLPGGYRHQLSLHNTGTRAMPAGLGLHPYFPRPGARLDAHFAGVWNTSADGLPTDWSPLTAMPDWFGNTTIDTVFTGRRGPTAITWPTHSLTIHPSAGLDFTTIYCPAGADFFCIEPVSHMTDALNRPEIADNGQRSLAPGESFTVSVDFVAA